MIRFGVVGLAILAIIAAEEVRAFDPPAKQMAVTRGDDGQPVCGLGKAFHAGRRAALFERIGDALFVIRGQETPADYHKFYQEKNFWYLTGVSSPDAALVLDGRDDSAWLFLPEPNPTKENWDGEIWDRADDWVSDLTGIANVVSTTQFESKLSELCAEKPAVYVMRKPGVRLAGGTDMAMPHQRARTKDPFDGRLSREGQLEAKLKEKFEVRTLDGSVLLTEMRLIKQPEELDAMRRAAEVGALAIAEGMRSTGPGRGEWEIESVMSFVHEKFGAAGPAYSAICGAGPNNNVLHYFHSNRRMKDGELLLVDYGPDLDFYTTDITRTWPVNGRFSDRQREIYAIVLEAQAEAIAAAKPGNTFSDIAAAVNRVFDKHEVRHLSRHFPGHFIGLEVHDVSTRGPFEPGMTLAIEPGLYSESEGFGIRIEDVVVITEEGCEILTRTVPVEASEVESLVQETGILEKE